MCIHLNIIYLPQIYINETKKNFAAAYNERFHWHICPGPEIA